MRRPHLLAEVRVYYGMKIGLVFALLCFAFAPAHGQSVSEQYLLSAANVDRAARGLRQLHFDEHLQIAARMHAYQMVRHGEISHQFAGEQDLAARAGEAGARFSLISENVAEAPDASQIHDLWMHSAGHRANLLDPAVDSVGIAVVRDRGEFYAVEDFGKSVRSLSLEQQENTVGQMLEGKGLMLVEERGNARQTCELSTGYAGGRQPWFVMRYTSSDIANLPPELTERLASGKYHQAAVGACVSGKSGPFSSYNLAVLLYP